MAPGREVRALADEGADLRVPLDEARGQRDELLLAGVGVDPVAVADEDVVEVRRLLRAAEHIPWRPSLQSGRWRPKEQKQRSRRERSSQAGWGPGPCRMLDILSKITQGTEKFVMPRNTRKFRRPMLDALVSRLREPRRFVQVLAGPRQTGKTTLAQQAIQALDLPAHYASADEPTLRARAWVEEQWEVGRLRAREAGRRGSLLVLDEVQKVTGWSEAVKRLWDEDSRPSWHAVTRGCPSRDACTPGPAATPTTSPPLPTASGPEGLKLVEGPAAASVPPGGPSNLQGLTPPRQIRCRCRSRRRCAP